MKVQCKCGKQFNIPPEAIGKKVRCTSCNATFRTSPRPSKTQVHVPSGGSSAKHVSQKRENPARQTVPCPSCEALLDPGAALCISCGFNLKTGEQTLTDEVIRTRKTQVIFVAVAILNLLVWITWAFIDEPHQPEPAMLLGTICPMTFLVSFVVCLIARYAWAVKLAGFLNVMATSMGKSMGSAVIGAALGGDAGAVGAAGSRDMSKDFKSKHILSAKPRFGRLASANIVLGVIGLCYLAVLITAMVKSVPKIQGITVQLDKMFVAAGVRPQTMAPPRLSFMMLVRNNDGTGANGKMSTDQPAGACQVSAIDFDQEWRMRKTVSRLSCLARPIVSTMGEFSLLLDSKIVCQ